MDSFQLDQIDSLRLLRCSPLLAAGFEHAFSTRRGGVSPLPAESLHLGETEQDGEASRSLVRENRRRFLGSLGLSDWPLRLIRQVHSATVEIVTEPGVSPVEPPPIADAVATRLPGILLGVQAADCLPLLLADRVTGAVAAVHAGWRGTVGLIVARTLEVMQRSFGTHPSDVLVALGPAIGPCCFEVGPEVAARFEAIDPLTRTHLLSAPTQEGKARLDLNLANLHQLRQAGVREDHVYDCKYCTVCHNDLFFSYRFERGTERPVGRHLAVIGRRQTGPHHRLLQR